MPEPRDLRMHEHAGRCVIMAGSAVLYDYPAGDAVMRNIALSGLRQLGFRGRTVASVLGLTENYVATVHNSAKRDGSAALVMQNRRGTPGKITAQQWEQARQWRGGGDRGAGVGGGAGGGEPAGGRPPGPARAGPPPRGAPRP